MLRFLMTVTTAPSLSLRQCGGFPGTLKVCSTSGTFSQRWSSCKSNISLKGTNEAEKVQEIGVEMEREEKDKKERCYLVIRGVMNFVRAAQFDCLPLELLKSHFHSIRKV